jgi:AraC family transcriptional regulator of arabinose operon
LLELSALSVKEVSREVGFDTPFYFTLRFKKFTGTSPREYRRWVQQGGDGREARGTAPARR